MRERLAKRQRFGKRMANWGAERRRDTEEGTRYQFQWSIILEARDETCKPSATTVLQNATTVAVASYGIDAAQPLGVLVTA